MVEMLASLNLSTVEVNKTLLKYIYITLLCMEFLWLKVREKSTNHPKRVCVHLMQSSD